MKFMKLKSGDFDKLIEGRDTKLIETDIIDWITYLKNEIKLSPATIKLYVAAVRHFYDMNLDVELRWRRINSFKPEFHDVVEDQPYTRKQIKTMLDKAEQRNRAIILLLSSSGMRVGALPNLRIGDLKPIDNYNIYQIQVYKRSKEKYITFCSSECRKEIDDYLKYRERYGERLNTDSPLFRTTFNRNDQLKAANKINKLSIGGIVWVINELLNTTGIRPSPKLTENQTHNKRTDIMQLHGFRKFFDTTCTSAGMNNLYTEMLMGHDVGLKGRYTKLSPEELLEGNDKNLGYLSAMEHLIICDENRLKRQVETLKVEKSKLDELAQTIADVKKQLGI